MQPEGGLGKVPINILEVLKDDISTNFISTWESNQIPPNLPQHTLKALNNPDQTAGKIGLLTDAIWHMGGKPTDKIPKNCIIKYAYSMMESTRIPEAWTKILNEEFDAVIVPDDYLIKVYKESGVLIPIFVLPIPMVLSPYLACPMHSRDLLKPFIFGDASANKNPEILVSAFAKTFKDNQNVQLVLRAASIGQETRNKIKALIDKYHLRNVSIEDGAISNELYLKKLASFDCYINLSHGEGFSFIPRESLALGIPVIITDNTSSKTICNSGFICPVKSSIKCRSSSIYDIVYGERCGEQFDCSEKDVIRALKKVYSNYSYFLKKAALGRKWVKKYDVNSPSLRALYKALIKPKLVVFGNENKLSPDTVTTASPELYNKYISIISENNLDFTNNVQSAAIPP